MDEATIRQQLEAWQVPPSLIGGVNVAAGVVTLVLEVVPSRVSALEPLRVDLQNKLQALAGVSKAQVVVTAAKEQPPAKPVQKPVAPGVKAIIAVASGKGGVGKSTVAVNLVAAAAQAGLKVGLLDADIYGPSLPILLNVHSGPPELDADRNMIPPVVHGIKVMSIGFMLDASRALVWRGPMVHSAINQMLRDVAWGELDVLFVDMPPGTGDAQLTMAQNGRLAGAVIVSTPQDLALADARRGVAMFEKVNVPILGIIENMSMYVCSQCHHAEPIFGHGGARAEAEKLGVPFLGELPLHIKVREAGDAGLPIVLADRESEAAQCFRKIIAQLQPQLALRRAG